MRQVYPRKATALPKDDKEQQAIEDMFINEDDEVVESHEGTVKFPVDTAKIDEVVDSYEATVYDFFTEEETGAMWEAKAAEFATIVRESLVSSLSFFDAVKSVEEHFQREMHSSVGLLDSEMVKAVTYLLKLKLFTIAAKDLKFTEDEAETIFYREVESIKTRAPLRNLVNTLKNTGVEENPYGTAGFSRKRREQQ